MSRQRKVPKIWEKDPFFRHLGRKNPNTRVRKKTKKQKNQQQGEEMKTRAEKIKLQIDELTKLDFYQQAAKMLNTYFLMILIVSSKLVPFKCNK